MCKAPKLPALPPAFILLLVVTSFVSLISTVNGENCSLRNATFSAHNRFAVVVLWGSGLQSCTQRFTGADTVVFRQPFHRPLLCGSFLQLSHLPFVIPVYRFLNGANGIQQTSVLLAHVLSADAGRLCCDEALLFKAHHIFANCVFAHAYRFADGLVTWVTLIGFPVLLK